MITKTLRPAQRFVNQGTCSLLEVVVSMLRSHAASVLLASSANCCSLSQTSVYRFSRNVELFKMPRVVMMFDLDALAMVVKTLNRFQRHGHALIYWISNVKEKDYVSSYALLQSFQGIQGLDVVLLVRMMT